MKIPGNHSQAGTGTSGAGTTARNRTGEREIGERRDKTFGNKSEETPSRPREERSKDPKLSLQKAAKLVYTLRIAMHFLNLQNASILSQRLKILDFFAQDAHIGVEEASSVPGERTKRGHSNTTRREHLAKNSTARRRPRRLPHPVLQVRAKFVPCQCRTWQHWTRAT